MAAIFNIPEDEINFESFINLPLRIFRLIFFDFYPLKENSSLKEKIVFYTRSVGLKFILTSFLVTIASYVACLFTNQDNVYDASGGVQNIASSICITIKPFAIYFNMEKILQMFEELSAMMEDRVVDGKVHRRKPYLDTYQRIIMAYSILFVMCSLSCVLEIIPFLINGSTNLTVQLWYPFDMHQREFFPLAWLSVNWVGYIMVFGLLSSDALLYGLITVLVMEFDFLKLDFMTINFVKNENHDVKKKRLRKLISKHEKLIELTGNLQEMYSSILLIVYIIVSIIICLCAFKTLLATQMSTLLFYGTVIGIMVGQVLLLGFYGQKLIDSSESIADGIYNCGWENFEDDDFKKQCALIMLRSQKACRLTALDFFEVSLDSTTLVIIAQAST